MSMPNGTQAHTEAHKPKKSRLEIACTWLGRMFAFFGALEVGITGAVAAQIMLFPQGSLFWFISFLLGGLIIEGTVYVRDAAKAMKILFVWGPYTYVDYRLLCRAYLQKAKTDHSVEWENRNKQQEDAEKNRLFAQVYRHVVAKEGTCLDQQWLSLTRSTLRTETKIRKALVVGVVLFSVLNAWGFFGITYTHTQMMIATLLKMSVASMPVQAKALALFLCSMGMMAYTLLMFKMLMRLALTDWSTLTRKVKEWFVLPTGLQGEGRKKKATHYLKLAVLTLLMLGIIILSVLVNIATAGAWGVSGRSVLQNLFAMSARVAKHISALIINVAYIPINIIFSIEQGYLVVKKFKDNIRGLWSSGKDYQVAHWVGFAVGLIVMLFLFAVHCGGESAVSAESLRIFEWISDAVFRTVLSAKALVIFSNTVVEVLCDFGFVFPGEKLHYHYLEESGCDHIHLPHSAAQLAGIVTGQPLPSHHHPDEVPEPDCCCNY